MDGQRLRPIVFTVDDRYIKPLAVALAGLLRHAGSGCRRRIYLFHEGMSPLYRGMLSRWLRNTSLELCIVRIRPSHRIKRLPHHFSRAILLRLCVAEKVGEPEFIYLDADILINREYFIIDTIELDDAILAASPWPQDRRSPGEKGGQPGVLRKRTYYGSGILLVNVRRFTQERIGARCLDLIEREQLEYPDQDALNRICPAEAWRSLPAELSVEVSDGVTDPARSTSGAAMASADSAEPCGIILQLAGAEKPWHLWNRHPLRHRFRRELRETPFRLLPPGPADIRWRSLLSRLGRRILRCIGIPPAGHRSA